MQVENRATTNEFSVDRIAVAGGWLYVTRAWDQRSKTFSIAQSFVADAESPGDIVAPVNVDVPMASQSGTTLDCTMGNWKGEPSEYAYQWLIDGEPVAAADPALATHEVTPEEVGKTATCVVTATNIAGSTVAPPSNGVVVT